MYWKSPKPSMDLDWSLVSELKSYSTYSICFVYPLFCIRCPPCNCIDRSADDQNKIMIDLEIWLDTDFTIFLFLTILQIIFSMTYDKPDIFWCNFNPILTVRYNFKFWKYLLNCHIVSWLVVYNNNKWPKNWKKRPILPKILKV